MRKRSLRRATFALLVATGPVITACEAVLDFDRSPLQPIYEAGTTATDATSAADRSVADGPSSDGARDAAPVVPDAVADSGLDAGGG